MPEMLQVGLTLFVSLCIGVALVCLLVFLIRFVLLRLANSWFTRGDNPWDPSAILHKVPSGIFAFLIIDILTVWFVSAAADKTLGRFADASGSMREILHLLGVAGIFAGTVFGIYFDYPATRMKILGLIAVFSALLGMG